MFAVMEPFLPRLLKRTGIIFERLGRDVDHHGTRAVYIADTRDHVRGMASEFRDLYTWIDGELQACRSDILGKGPDTLCGGPLSP